MMQSPDLAQIEDFLDGELSEQEVLEFKQKLSQSTELQLKLKEAEALKLLLGDLPVPAPEAGYWEQSTASILARTTLSKTDTEPVPRPVQPSFSSPAWSTALSVAASLVIFFSALAVGSMQQEQSVVVMQRTAYVALASEAESNPRPEGWEINADDRSVIASGILSIGTLSRSSRIEVTQDMLALR